MLVNQSNKSNVNYNALDDRRNPINSHENDVSWKSENFDWLIERLSILFLDRYSQSLSNVEILILEGIWQRKTYSEIACESNYSPDYFTNVAAPKLLKKLSTLVGSRITKKSCRSLLTNYLVENTFARSPNLASEAVSYSCKSSRTEQITFLNSSFLQDAIYLAKVI